MHTIAAARTWAVQQLKSAQIQSPSLTADLLLSAILGWDRVRILSHPEEALPEAAWKEFQSAVQRRINGEPVQYITGVQEFYGLTFHVGPGVLIPRPETEILVEKAISLIQEQFSSQCRFLDIGTGSGCIAVSIAHQLPDCKGWAVDISNAALEIARENLARHRVSGRILLVRSSLLDCFSRTPQFDFIFCNPPYVALKDCDSLPSEVKNYEPHTAIFGGESGMELYRELIPQTTSRLTPGGYLLLELGLGQSEEVSRLVQNAGMMIVTIMPDLQGIPRCLVGHKPPGVSNG